ncbi:MAG TPA: riboflavin kinase, partial [Luteimonas sp.]|nr:riboflavin kinase [Luteimonas sp.]
VEFVAKLRDEARFDSLPALVAQMERDAAQARVALEQATLMQAQQRAYA